MSERPYLFIGGPLHGQLIMADGCAYMDTIPELATGNEPPVRYERRRLADMYPIVGQDQREWDVYATRDALPNDAMLEIAKQGYPPVSAGAWW